MGVSAGRRTVISVLLTTWLLVGGKQATELTRVRVCVCPCGMTPGRSLCSKCRHARARTSVGKMLTPTELLERVPSGCRNMGGLGHLSQTPVYVLDVLRCVSLLS